MKIGIPRALAYYAYYPFIKTFFEKIGLEVIVSGQTTKQIVNEGAHDAITMHVLHKTVSWSCERFN